MYLDFCIQVPLNTYLFQIKTKIADRHGRITDIVMYRDSVDDDNKLDDEMLTFEDMGFEGKPGTEGPVVSAANANAYSSVLMPAASLTAHAPRASHNDVPRWRDSLQSPLKLSPSFRLSPSLPLCLSLCPCRCLWSLCLPDSLSLCLRCLRCLSPLSLSRHLTPSSCPSRTPRDLFLPQKHRLWYDFKPFDMQVSLACSFASFIYPRG